MKNPVMNYNQFMSSFKSGEKAYSKKADIKNKDAKDKSSTNQELATDQVKGSGTSAINKYTKEHLAKVKSGKVIKGK